MRVLEKQVENPVVKWAKDQGIHVKKKVFGEQLDRWFFFPSGHLFIIEFKAPKKRLTGLQEEEIKKLHALGFDVEVHDDKNEAIEALKLRGRLHGTVPNEVDATQIPERFRCLAIDPCVRRPVRRPRNRKDFHNPSRPKRS